MGSSESKPVSYSKRMPTTSSGYFGRDRTVTVRKAFLCYYKSTKFDRLHVRDMATIAGLLGFALGSQKRSTPLIELTSSSKYCSVTLLLHSFDMFRLRTECSPIIMTNLCRFADNQPSKTAVTVGHLWELFDHLFRRNRVVLNLFLHCPNALITWCSY